MMITDLLATLRHYCKLAQQLLLQLLLHHPAGCKLAEQLQNNIKILGWWAPKWWAVACWSYSLVGQVQSWANSIGAFSLIKSSFLDVACKLENVVMAGGGKMFCNWDTNWHFHEICCLSLLWLRPWTGGFLLDFSISLLHFTSNFTSCFLWFPLS